jgi:hypothetical protein
MQQTVSSLMKMAILPSIALVFILVVAVNCQSVPTHYDVIWGDKTMTSFINITRFSQLGNEETYTNSRNHIDVSDQDVGVKHAFKWRSWVSNDPLQLFIAVDAAIDKHVPNFSINGNLIIGNPDLKKNFVQYFKGINITDENPRSPIFNLLTKDVLMNPKNGWYDKNKDELLLQVKINWA